MPPAVWCSVRRDVIHTKGNTWLPSSGGEGCTSLRWFV